MLKIPFSHVMAHVTMWGTSWQNQQNGLCAQRRLGSAWASTQSDQSFHCPHKESLTPQLPIERTVKTLIRLGGCPGWSESSLGAKVILLVLSWGGSCISFRQRVIANFIKNSNITVKLLSDIIFAEYFHKNKPGHGKMCLMSYANNKGTDQPAHPKFQDSS